jgi:cell division protein FtsN
LAQLQAEGFDAAFTEVNPEGLNRVAYGRFTSKREALNLHNYIRYALKEEAWFLEEN